MKLFFQLAYIFIQATFLSTFLYSYETLPRFSADQIPQDFESLWRNYDPQKEPLETEILKEWEQDDVVMRVIRYRIGIFKEKKAMMAGIYGFPKGQKKLPALLQVHGGGQYASHQAVLTNAKRGYSTLSIAWAGRISAPGYMVTPNEVKLFWANKTDDPKYKLTTDWGALDAYHAPSRNGRDAFPSIPVAEWTLDPVVSPRNNSWFLITLGGRRGLTFLEQQPEVDAEKLGVYGHSMGGKLTVMIAGADQRVKAAAPSCGGISDRYTKDDLHYATVSDPPSLKRINCPVIFLSPSNDFHGRINDLESSVNEIQSKDWRISTSPHHNHQDTAEYEVATQIWFDHHLKGNFQTPATPETELVLMQNCLPEVIIKPDSSHEIVALEVYFTQQGILQKRGMTGDDSLNTKHRFWKFVQPVEDPEQKIWKAELPIFETNRSLWFFANVHYKLDSPIAGAGYYYGSYETNRLNLSSLLEVVSPEQLQEAGVLVTHSPRDILETFTGSWRKDWFTYKPEKWGMRTNKLYEPYWDAPSSSARLSLEICAEEPNQMVLWIDGFGTELKLLGNGLWQKFNLSPKDLTNADGISLANWSNIRELRLDDSEKLKTSSGSKAKAVKIGGSWKGNPPEFRNLRWLK